MRVCGNKQELIKWTVWHSCDRHFTVASSFFLCICVCVCICTRAHMCLCVCVCMRAHAYVCVHACACAHVCVCVCESVLACVCMRACVCVSVFVCVRVWVCVHEHMCVSFLWYRCLEVNVCIPEHRKHKSHQAQMDHRLCPYVPVQQDHCGHRVSHVLIIEPSLFLSGWLSWTIQTARTKGRREEEARQVSSTAALDRSRTIIAKSRERRREQKGINSRSNKSNSQFTIHNSQITIHNSQFTIHNSQLVMIKIIQLVQLLMLMRQ